MSFVTMMAEELFKFDMNSKVARELDALWAESIVKKKQVVEEGTAKGRTFSKNVDIFSNWFEKNIMPTFRKILLDNFGITIEKMIYTYGFAMGIDGETRAEGNRLAEGLFASEGKHKITDKSTIDYLRKFNGVIDFEKKTFVFTKLNPKLKFYLVFDIELSFFGNDMIVTTTKSSAEKASKELAMTPSEITAIILHEIGHMFTMAYVAEHTGHIAAFNTATIREMISVMRKSSPEEIIALAEEINGNTKRLRGDKDYKPSDINSISNTAYKKAITTNNSFMAKVAANMIFIDSILNILIELVATYAFVFIGNRYIAYAPAGSSSVTVTNKSYNHLERLADEFVSSFGYSEFLNTGLKKYTDILHYAAAPEVVDIFRSENMFLKPFALLIKMMILFDMMFTPLRKYIYDKDRTVYEDWETRLNRNIMNYYNILNNDKTLSDAEKKYLIESIDSMRDQIKSAMKTNMFVIVIGKMIATLSLFLTGSAVIVPTIDILSNANMMNEIESALNDVDSIFNNTLKYHGLKIRQLGR